MSPNKIINNKTTSPSCLRADTQQGAAELPLLIDDEGELCNCFSINQLVEENVILNARTKTSVKR